MGYLFLLLLSSAVVYMSSRGTAVMDNACSPCMQVILGRMLTLERQVVELKNTVADLERKNEELSGSLNDQTTERRENQNKIIQLEEQNKQFNITVRQMQTEVVQIKDSTLDVNKTAKCFQMELTQLTVLRSDLNNTIQSLQIDLMQIKESNSEFNKSVQSVQIEMVKVNRRTSEMNMSIEGQKTKLAQIVELSSQLNNSIQSVQVEIVQVGRKTSEINLSIKDQIKTLAHVEEFNSELNNSFLDLQKSTFLLETQSKYINDTILHLQHESALFKTNTTVQELLADVYDIHTEVMSIYDQLAGQTLSLHLLQNSTAKLDEQSEEMNLSLEDIRSEMKTLAAKTDEFDSTVQNSVKELSFTNATSTVAFTAKRVGSANLTSGEILVFDEVLGNTHGAYNQTTGVFVAPVDGNYLFSVTVLSQYDKYAHLRIVKNDTIELGRAFTGSPHHWSSGSETIAVDLGKDDKVCVKHLLLVSNVPANVYGERYTSFMGVLLSSY